MSARGQKWLDSYNSIPTTHDEDEGRRTETIYPFANPISMLLFASILAGIQKGTESLKWTRASIALRTCSQISGRIKFRVDDDANNSIVTLRFTENHLQGKRVRNCNKFAKYWSVCRIKILSKLLHGNFHWIAWDVEISLSTSLLI